MENKSLRFYAIMALWVVLFVLLFVSNRRVDLKTDINKSTSVSVSVEDTGSTGSGENEYLRTSWTGADTVCGNVQIPQQSGR